jgi:hypothetical protein
VPCEIAAASGCPLRVPSHGPNGESSRERETSPMYCRPCTVARGTVARESRGSGLGPVHARVGVRGGTTAFMCEYWSRILVGVRVSVHGVCDRDRVRSHQHLRTQLVTGPAHRSRHVVESRMAPGRRPTCGLWLQESVAGPFAAPGRPRCRTCPARSGLARPFDPVPPTSPPGVEDGPGPARGRR